VDVRVQQRKICW